MSTNGHELKERRDGIELAMTLLGPQGKAVTDCFVAELQETLLALLNPELDAEKTMYQKQRALATISTLDRMGVKISKVRDMTTARVARQAVSEGLRMPISGKHEDDE